MQHFESREPWQRLMQQKKRYKKITNFLNKGWLKNLLDWHLENFKIIGHQKQQIKFWNKIFWYLLGIIKFLIFGLGIPTKCFLKIFVRPYMKYRAGPRNRFQDLCLSYFPAVLLSCCPAVCLLKCQALWLVDAVLEG